MLRGIKVFLFLSLFLFVSCQKDDAPNIVIFLADDFGYGDLPITGHPTIEAPHITRMAQEGLFLQQFYSGDCVCTPSRAALMTGQYSVRNGFFSNFTWPLSSLIRVLLPLNTDGLQTQPTTIAEALKKNANYVSALIGKWHLGHLNDSLPTQHGGFDYFYGIPFAGNFGCDLWQNTSNHPYYETVGCQNGWAGLPLMQGTEVIEQPMHQPSFESRLAKESINFLEQNKKKKTFLYHAFHHTHIPLNPGPEYVGTSLRGKYGDSVAEIDGVVGQILDYIRNNKNDRCTVAFFTSDNGPWLRENLDGGSAGLFRAGKGSTYEGGVRVPSIIWSNCPQKYKGLNGGLNNRAIAGSIDYFPTIMELAKIPKKVYSKYNLDGYSLLPLIKGTAKTTGRDFIPYFRGPLFMAARQGSLKAHFILQDDEGNNPPVYQNPPVYYDLNQDPSEKYPLTSDKLVANYQDLLTKLNANVAALNASITPLPFPLMNKLTNNSLVCCRSDPTAPPCVCGGKKALEGVVPGYTPIIPPVSR